MQVVKWEVHKFQKLIDAIATSILFIFSNITLLCGLLGEIEIVEEMNSIVFILCFLLIYFVSVIAFFSYRVVQVDELIEIQGVFGKKNFQFKNIRNSYSFLRVIYVIKLPSNTIVLWNHLGGAERLQKTIKKGRGLEIR